MAAAYRPPVALPPVAQAALEGTVPTAVQAWPVTTLYPSCRCLPCPCRFATLRKLLCSDSLWGGCEYDVFCAVLKWVGAESAREGHLAELLGLIRFPTMTLDQLTAVGKEPRVVACPGFKVGTHVAGAGVWCLHKATRSLPCLQAGK